MNALVKKEIRLLLPSFLIGVALTFSNWLLPESSTGFRAALFVFPFLLCPAMAVMMALDSFGAEVSSGTFSTLLAQPVSRARIWRIKTLLLAAALSIVGILWCISFYLHIAPFKDPKDSVQDFVDLFIGVWVFLLVVFSGGLWTVLVLRQVAAAFWFTLLVPSAILVLMISLTGDTSTKVFEQVVVIVLGIYTLAGIWFARRLFMRAQDTQWTGGTIAMPEMRGISLRFAGSGTARCWRPRAALWWKEIQLHQSQFIMAGVLALLHLGVLATRHWGHFEKNSSMAFVLDSFWCLWLVMPLCVGCAAMAEERKMGTLDGQLCLPIRRRTQFITKFLVVLLVSVLLGIAMPLLLEGTRVLPDFQFAKVDGNGVYLTNSYGRGLGYYANPNMVGTFGLTLAYMFFSLSAYLPFLFMAMMCAVVAAIAFYASTLARNTLQALAPAALGLLLTWFLLMVAAMPYEFGLGFLWRGYLIFLIVIPVMTVVLAALAYGNSQRGRIGGGVWGRNLFTLGIALALVTGITSATYHRAWELLSPLETPHGAVRWTTAKPPRIQNDNNRVAIYLPDGRVWMNRYDWYAPSPFELEPQITESRMFGGGKFLEGTNWADAQDCWRDIVGIQRDGSLWVSAKPDNFNYRSWLIGKMVVSEATKLARFGDNHDWKSVGGESIMPFLLKTDGTLWLWGTNRLDRNRPWPGLHAFTPRRLGTEADWEKIFSDNGRTFFCKTNGQIWTDRGFSDTDEKLDLGNRLILNRVLFLEHKKWRNATAIGQINWAPFQAGILEDGTLRELAVWERVANNPEISQNSQTTSQRKYVWKYTPRDVQIGQATNWQDMAVNGDAIVTLKTDGTLWKWNLSQQDYRGRPTEMPDLKNISPARISTHSDWVAIGEMMGGIASLAADGSLYLWRFEPEGRYYSHDGFPPLLGTSRRPQLLGNIFELSKNTTEPATDTPDTALRQNVTGVRPNPLPIPPDAPLDASLLSVSNTPDGSRVVWYCLSNHTSQGVVLLGDERAQPYYLLVEYLPSDLSGTIQVTNHNMVNFFHSCQMALPSNAATKFAVQIPFGVTNAVVYINYLLQKNGREVKREELVNDFRSWVGLETPTRKSEPYINYPLPLP